MSFFDLSHERKTCELASQAAGAGRSTTMTSRATETLLVKQAVEAEGGGDTGEIDRITARDYGPTLALHQVGS